VATGVPQGIGAGTITVKSSGAVSLSGKLPDGTAISSSGALGQADTFPLYKSLYKNTGYVSGLLTFETTGTNAILATVAWSDPATFGMTGLALVGNRFTPETSLAQDFQGGTISLSGGGITAFDATASQTSADALSATAGDGRKVTLSIGKSNGAVSGELLNADKKLAFKVTGVLLQEQDQATGFFLETGSSGVLEVTPP
jgi:hypothetical protein